MMKAVTQVLEEDSAELTELVSTNKTLAMEKREVHRQKLRLYSEKAVKLRCLLRETEDQEEKRCLEGKLKALQQKQDAEITKLATIDQIEKEIDQFITEENEEDGREKDRASAGGSSGKPGEGTPAQRLRTKSSIPSRGHLDGSTEPHFDFSRKRTSFSKKSSTD
jgi:septal ring factor EnvC (AmiA/AmiB activator)